MVDFIHFEFILFTVAFEHAYPALDLLIGQVAESFCDVYDSLGLGHFDFKIFLN
jgi:hypothetical protein